MCRKSCIPSLSGSFKSEDTSIASVDELRSLDDITDGGVEAAVTAQVGNTRRKLKVYCFC